MFRTSYRVGKQSRIVQLSLLVGSLAFVLYIVNKTFFTKRYDWTFAHYYLNDVLAGILIVAIVNVLAVLSHQRRLLLISLIRILVFTLACGLFWEYVTPLYVTYSVWDPFDVLAYMFGGFCNWCIIRFELRFTRRE
ncbi:hypothetical protein [Sporosarcina pasteurii]|nr:hypothetical protein [Sporosarcina pasteurii]MDS9470714.1 hypothetical protein [Sporosarcina pasteurii]QBQ05606.1 hypothetical protein E2C16_07965 [Sporosarcina pasteurii]